MRTKVLFVCLGNICRSPLAEALFKKHVQEAGVIDEFEIDSCGTANYHIGDPPDQRSYANAFQNGVVIEHTGRQLSYDDLLRFDILLAMDQSNLANIKKLSLGSPEEGKIMLMREFDPELVEPEDVPDPYYGGDQGFQLVFDILNRSTGNLLQKLR